MNANHNVGKAFVITLGSLIAMTALSVDISLPAIPEMVRALSTTLSAGQQIVGVFMLGIAIGQIPAGLLSDRWGRMPVLLVGTIIFTASATLCAMAGSIETMLAGRLLQGIGASAGVVVARAMVRDISSGKETARLMSLMTMVFTAAPMLAPAVGAFLTVAYGWRMPFTVLAMVGFVMIFVSMLVLHETHTPERQQHILGQLVSSAKLFFSHPQSIFGLLLVVLPTAAFLSLIAVSSSLVIEIYGYPVQSFGWIFATAGVAILAAATLNRRLLLHFSLMQVICFGAILMLIASLNLLLIAWLNGANFVWLWGSVCLFFFSAGFTSPNAAALALDPLPRIAGAASSFVGAVQTLASSFSALAASRIYDGSVRNSIILLGAIGIVTPMLFMFRRYLITQDPDDNLVETPAA